MARRTTSMAKIPLSRSTKLRFLGPPSQTLAKDFVLCKPSKRRIPKAAETQKRSGVRSFLCGAGPLVGARGEPRLEFEGFEVSTLDVQVAQRTDADGEQPDGEVREGHVRDGSL